MKTPDPPATTIRAWVVKVQVQPIAACHWAMKNCSYVIKLLVVVKGIYIGETAEGRGAYWISERTEVQEYSVENYHAGGLERVGVDDVAACYGVADLDSGGDCSLNE